MNLLFALLGLAIGVFAGRVWQFLRDLTRTRPELRAVTSHDAMADIASRRRRAEEQINRVTHFRRHR